MGPNGTAGFQVTDYFQVIFHSAIDDSYAAVASDWYGRGDMLDGWGFGMVSQDRRYDEPLMLKADHGCRSLTLDCVVLSDSKTVRVDLKYWINHVTEDDTDIYLCGELAVVGDDVEYKKKSFLFKTPPNKAIKIRNGMPIPLSRSVVAVPFDSGFRVTAKFGCPDDVDDHSGLDFPTFNASASFPNIEIGDHKTAMFLGYDFEGLNPEKDKGLRTYCYTCTKYIHGTDGQIEVTVTVDLK